MKKMMIGPALAGALLAACGGQDDGNNAADANILVEPLGNGAMNGVSNTGEAAANGTSESAGAAGPEAGSAAPAPQPAPANTAPPEPSAAKRPSTRPPQPKADPDPHAGHDMGNMANMQR